MTTNMRKMTIATILALVVGTMGMVSAQSLQDENLKGIHAFDGSNNFFGVMLEGQQRTMFGTADSITQLDLNTTRVCYHYVTQGGQGLFGMGQEGMNHDLQCQNYNQLSQQQQQELTALSGDGMNQGNMTQNMTENNTASQ